MLRLRPVCAAVADAAAIDVFVVIGLLSHRGGVSGRDFAEDALPLLGCWFAAALALRLYANPSVARFILTCLLGITAGVAVRAAVLGHTRIGKEAAFLAVALSVTLVFALAARALTAWVLRR